jgi:multidrug transporter EmrE-like cation transporter
MLVALLVASLAGAFGVAGSMLLNWTSGKSPLWNIGFFLVLVLTSAAGLLLILTVLSRSLFPPND